VQRTYLRVDEMLDAWLQHLVRVLGPMEAMIARAGRDFPKGWVVICSRTDHTSHTLLLETT
jgi:hypothetical protein